MSKLKHYILKYAIIIFLININTIVFAQVEFTASSNTNTVGLQQSFNITYTLKGGKGQSFERPNFENFRLVGQSSRSSGGMTVIINNQVVSGGNDEQSWIFTLLPTTHGKFTIAPAKVRVDGKTYTSNSLEITVMNTGQTQQSTQAQSTQAQSSQNQAQQKQSQSSGQIGDQDIFIKAIPSKNSAWIGEPIIITYKIFTRVQIPSYSINRIPSFIGFWTEDISETSKPTEEIINGERYTTAIIRKSIVFPQQSGKLTIEPLEVEAIARLIKRTQRRSMFDDFDDIFNQFFNDPFFSTPSFGSSYEDIKTTVKSNQITINIKELPISKKPASFSGQVGNYTMEAWFDKDRILLNDALNLTIKISGNGNLNLMDIPNIQFPKSFDIFDPEIKSDIKHTSIGTNGSKTFNFLIIPREPGLYKISPIEFSFFSIAQSNYITLYSDNFEIEVVGKEGLANNQNAIGQTENDIRYIKTKPSSFNKIGEYFVFSKLFYILFLLPILLFFALLFFIRKNMKLHSNQQILKYKRATNIAKKRLKKSAKLLKDKKIDEFYIETSKAIWQYVKDRFIIEQSELSIQKVSTQLSKQGIDGKLVEELEQILNFCEFVRFAPGSKEIEPESILTDAQNIIAQIEQHINKKIK